jgi:uncharacterized membrane protein
MPCRIRTYALPLVVLLVACGAPKPAVPPAEPATSESAVHSPSKVSGRGIASLTGTEVSFRECGTPAAAARTLLDADHAIADAFAALGVKPPDGLYVELDGSDALLRARSLRIDRDCDEPVFDGEFVVNGDDPFWQIAISDAGIVFNDSKNPLGKGTTFPYAFTRTETGSVLYATKLDKPKSATLEIALESGRCIDTAHTELRNFKAHVVKDGQKLEGCAFAGVPHGEFGDAPLDELNRFAGTGPNAVGLFKDPAIKKRLEDLLGAAMPTFVDNMKVQAPLMKNAGVFYVTGNKAHEGGSDTAVFLADPATDTIEVILVTHGTRQDLKEGGRDVPLPADVATFLGNTDKH